MMITPAYTGWWEEGVDQVAGTTRRLMMITPAYPGWWEEGVDQVAGTTRRLMMIMRQ
jgi:hypothetical protein